MRNYIFLEATNGVLKNKYKKCLNNINNKKTKIWEMDKSVSLKGKAKGYEINSERNKILKVEICLDYKFLKPLMEFLWWT